MENFDDVFLQIDRAISNGTVKSQGRQESDKVLQAEQRLGGTFPEAYRHFLLRFGSLSRGDNRISGLFSEHPLGIGRQDVVFDTEDVRAEWELPSDYIVINYDDTLNGMYCILLNALESDPPVFDYELNEQSFYQVYTSLTEYLLDFIT